MGAALSLKLNIKEELGMKKLEIIIKPEKLEDLKGVLDTEEVNGLNIVNSMGYGNQKGIIKNYRGAEYSVNLLPKIKVETVVADEVAPKLIDKIVDEINTGHFEMVRSSCMMSKMQSVFVQVSMARKHCKPV